MVWHFCLPAIELEKDNERKRGGEEDEQDKEERVNEKKMRREFLF